MTPKQHYYPGEFALQILSGKWKTSIMWILSQGPRRFSQLQSFMAGVPKQSLSDRLRELETDGIIYRRPYQFRPARYEYGMTEEGEELFKVVKQLCLWTKQRLPNQVFPGEECIELARTSGRSVHKP